MTDNRRWTAFAALAAVVGLSDCTWVSSSSGPSTDGSAGAAGEGGEAAATGGVENPGSGGGAAEDSGGLAGDGGTRRETGGAPSETDGGEPGSGGRSTGGESAGGARTAGAPTGGSSTKGTGGLQQTGGIGQSGGTGGRGEAGGTGGALGGGGTGGTQEPSGGTGGTEPSGGTGGTEPSGGTGGAGTTGGSGGSGGGDAATVHGRVIDFWGHLIPGIPVDVDGTLTQTDENGAFVVQDVSPQYDASLAISLTTRSYGWVYQGLTRRDPTLQVYTGLEKRWGDFTVSQQNGSFDTNRTFTVAFGSPDGSEMHDGIGDNGVTTDTPWYGPAQTTATAHGLLWQYDDGTHLPTSYVAYDSRLVALAEDSSAEFELDLTSETIASGNVMGSVVPVTSADRENAAFVRFNTGAMIEVARDSTGPDSFTYLVPTLPNGSISVSASEGNPYSDSFSLAHADGLAGGATATLTLPSPASLVLPASGTTGVTASTPFQFAPGEGSGGAYLVAISSVDYYNALFIVTAEERFTLPTVAQGAYVLMADEVFEWWVETHGNQATVDEMAGPDGCLDSFSLFMDRPAGPRQGDGEFTMAAARSFRTAE